MAKTTHSPEPKSRRLYRSEHDKVIGGVAGGLAEYFGIDPLLIRIIFVFLTLVQAYGILIYLILWFLIPSESKIHTTNDETMRDNIEDMRTRAQDVIGKVRANFDGPADSRNWWAFIIIVIGVLFLLSNLGYFDSIDFEKLWPVALILLGISIFIKQ